MMYNIKKMMRSIKTFASLGLGTQSANLTNTVKASFDIPQDYKEKVAALPPHFVAMMYELYQECVFEVCDAALLGNSEQDVVAGAEKKFLDKSVEAIKLLPETGELLATFRKHMSEMFQKCLAESESAKKEMKEEAKAHGNLQSQGVISDQTINAMLEYVSKLKAEDKTALIYDLGLVKYLTDSAPATADVHDDLKEVTKDENLEQEIEDVKEEPKVGPFPLNLFKQKMDLAINNHKFASEDELEMECLETICAGVDEMSMKEIVECVEDKLGINIKKAKDMDQLLDSLDAVADEYAQVLQTPISLAFMVVDQNLNLCAVFTKSDVAHIPHAVAKHISPITLSVKKEIECLAKWKSLNAVKMKDLRKEAPGLAKWVSATMSDFRNGKMCAWEMANCVKRPMKALIEACYGQDAAAYYDHCQSK